jgi:hypothetical protein
MDDALKRIVKAAQITFIEALGVHGIKVRT